VSNLKHMSVYEGDLREKLYTDVLHRCWNVIYRALYVDNNDFVKFEMVDSARSLLDLANEVQMQQVPFPHIAIDVRTCKRNNSMKQ